MRTSTIFALALPTAVVLAQETTRVTSTVLNPITTTMTSYSASSSPGSVIANTTDATGVMTAFGNSTSSSHTAAVSSAASQPSSAASNASSQATGSSDAGAFQPNIAMAVFAAAVALF